MRPRPRSPGSAALTPGERRRALTLQMTTGGNRLEGTITDIGGGPVGMEMQWDLGAQAHQAVEGPASSFGIGIVAQRL